MTETMMALGDFRFSMDTAAYNKLTRTHSYNWPSQSRAGRKPAAQFTGPGEEAISMAGIVYPHFRGGLGQVEAMNMEAAKGEPLQLVDGNGRFWGVYAITKIKEGHEFIDGSGTPYKQTFSLDLKAYGGDAPTQGANGGGGS